jgi:geranylgeranyl pyrophosphate synthase
MTIEEYVQRCNKILQDRCENLNLPDSKLQQAISYSLLGPGKRLRAALIYAVAQLFDKPPEIVDGIAAAIEAIHCYSLIHDDLPAMDDDDMRRGVPSCHKKFNDAIAILAGDALHSLAFRWINESPALNPEQCRSISYQLAIAIGPSGMIGGQAMDINNAADLEKVHYLKTGALICAAIETAAIACNATADSIKHLREYAAALGLGYQLRDDILDSASDTQANSCNHSNATTVEAKIEILAAQAKAALENIPGDDAALEKLITLTLFRSN